jgi:starch phosphorylase
VLFVREYLRTRNKKTTSDSHISINEILNPDSLTIGFARRFATYKRSNLIFKDMNRLKKIITNSERPVQLLIAGKAHPHDTQGKEVIQSIIYKIREYGLEKHIVFIEDYDLVVARMMVKGCDI